MVYDTLYGQTGQKDGFKATPQMLEGHTVENDGKTWKLTLRDGLLFHNGDKVLARDCVASIKRWGARDAFGQALMARTDEISAPDDKTIVIKPEAAVRAAARRDVPRCLQHVRDHAAAHRRDRSVQGDHRGRRQRPIHLQRRRSACRARCSSTSVLTSTKPRAERRGELHRRPKGRALRPRRMACAARCRHQVRGDAGGGDGLVGEPAPRRAAAAARRPASRRRSPT